MNKLLAKWQSLYNKKLIRDQTLEQYTTVYIQSKLVPMWPDGWMKVNDIQSHFMPSEKPPKKEPKKQINELKPSKPPSLPIVNSAPVNSVVADILKDNVMVTHNMKKKESHVVEETSKPMKTNSDKPTAHKTEKKYPMTLDPFALSPPITRDPFASKPV